MKTEEFMVSVPLLLSCIHAVLLLCSLLFTSHNFIFMLFFLLEWKLCYHCQSSLFIQSSLNLYVNFALRSRTFLALYLAIIFCLISAWSDHGPCFWIWSFNLIFDISSVINLYCIWYDALLFIYRLRLLHNLGLLFFSLLWCWSILWQGFLSVLPV